MGQVNALNIIYTVYLASVNLVCRVDQAIFKCSD